MAASTQNQAFNAILFLYKQVRGMDILGKLVAVRAKRPERRSTVLSVDEVDAIIDCMIGMPQLIVKVLYGSGLKGTEAVRLRVMMSISS